MECIFKLINFFKINTNFNDCICEIGTVHKKIGNRYFLSPSSVDLDAVSIIVNGVIVKEVGVTLNKSICTKMFIDAYGLEFEKNYNHYDSETVIIIKDKKIVLNCFIDGYTENIFKSEISRFKILII